MYGLYGLSKYPLGMACISSGIWLVLRLCTWLVLRLCTWLVLALTSSMALEGNSSVSIKYKVKIYVLVEYSTICPAFLVHLVLIYVYISGAVREIGQYIPPIRFISSQVSIVFYSYASRFLLDHACSML